MYVFAKTNTEEDEEILYFRKFNALHGWLQNYANMDADKFNCHKLNIDKELLDKLRQDVLESKLENKSYFFWGSAWSEDQIKEGVNRFILTCESAIKDGKQIYYFAWF